MISTEDCRKILISIPVRFRGHQSRDLNPAILPSSGHTGNYSSQQVCIIDEYLMKTLQYTIVLCSALLCYKLCYFHLPTPHLSSPFTVYVGKRFERLKKYDLFRAPKPCPCSWLLQLFFKQISQFLKDKEMCVCQTLHTDRGSSQVRLYYHK